MDVITTTLEREWFAKIAAGFKQIEYRKINPYRTKRLNRVRVPFKLVLRNGMNPPIPVLTVRIDRIQANPPHYRVTYGLYIGRILKIEHWDRRQGDHGKLCIDTIPPARSGDFETDLVKCRGGSLQLVSGRLLATPNWSGRPAQ